MLALIVKVPTMSRLRKIRSFSADPKYSADHGPLPALVTWHCDVTWVRVNRFRSESQHKQYSTQM